MSALAGAYAPKNPEGELFVKVVVRCYSPCLFPLFGLAFVIFGASQSHFWLAMYGGFMIVFVGVSAPIQMSVSDSGLVTVQFLFRRHRFPLHEIRWLHVKYGGARAVMRVATSYPRYLFFEFPAGIQQFRERLRELGVSTS